MLFGLFFNFLYDHKLFKADKFIFKKYSLTYTHRMRTIKVEHHSSVAKTDPSWNKRNNEVLDLRLDHVTPPKQYINCKAKSSQIEYDDLRFVTNFLECDC